MYSTIDWVYYLVVMRNLFYRKICSTCITEGLCDVVPVHIPVPVTASECFIVTEILIAAFSFLCGFIQYFNVYQSSWWLPNSHFGLVHFYSVIFHFVVLFRWWELFNFQNSYLIDWFVVQFIVAMTLRPFIFTVVKKYVMKLVNRFENNRNLSPCLR